MWLSERERAREGERERERGREGARREGAFNTPSPLVDVYLPPDLCMCVCE